MVVTSLHVSVAFKGEGGEGSLLERVPTETTQNCVLVTGQNTSAGLLVSCYCRLKFLLGLKLLEWS